MPWYMIEYTSTATDGTVLYGAGPVRADDEDIARRLFIAAQVPAQITITTVTQTDGPGERIHPSARETEA